MAESEEIPIGSVETVAEILDVLQVQDGAGISELADRMDLSKSSIHRYLTSLKRVGFIQQSGTQYSISAQVLKYGNAPRNRSDFFTTAKPVVEELVNRTNNSVALAVSEDAVIYLYKSWKEREIRSDLEIGQPYGEYHSSAAGKMLLASMPDEQATTVLDKQGMEQFTANTITDQEVLMEEIATISERKIAFDDEEYITGIRSVATDVRDRDDDSLIGVITIYGPAIRLDGDTFWEELPTTLERAANLIEVNMRYGHQQ